MAFVLTLSTWWDVVWQAANSKFTLWGTNHVIKVWSALHSQLLHFNNSFWIKHLIRLSPCWLFSSFLLSHFFQVNSRRLFFLIWYAVEVKSVCSRLEVNRRRDGGREQKGTRQESTRPRVSAVKQQGGLRGSAVTGQHPIVWRKGVPVLALFCNLREYKHGQTEVSKDRGKTGVLRMLNRVPEGGSNSMLLLKSNMSLLAFMLKYRFLSTCILVQDHQISLTISD